MASSRICSVSDCDKAARALGFCESHYRRFRRHGDPLGGAKSPGELMDFIQDIAVPYTGSDCLLWPFSRTRLGYGKISIKSKDREAHRVVCELVHGSPPGDNYCAAHSCGRGHEGCVNPSHLRWATLKENCQDKVRHDTHTRGVRNKLARLNEDAVRQIRSMRGEVSQAEMAKMFGVGTTTINRVCQNQSWSWLE